MIKERWCPYCKIFEETEFCNYNKRREQEGRHVPSTKKLETLDGMVTKDGGLDN